MATHCKEVGGVNEMKPLRSTPLAGGEIPQRVLVAPWGQVESTNGSFVVDEESAQAAIEAFLAHDTDLPIDYEHQTLGGTYASPSGKAPAAGWIKKLEAQVGVGLIAEIEWTDRAREMLSAKEYRYLSPVAIVRKSDRKLVGIHSAALTNKPAIVGMDPIVNRIDVGGLDDGSGPWALLRAELDLPEEAEPQTVLLAAGERLASLARDVRTRHVEERVREAMRSGKLVEAQRTWAEALVSREEDLFEEWFRTAPVVVRPGILAGPGETDGCEQRQRAIVARARAEFGQTSVLTALTSEEAYVADALRMAAC